MPNKETFFFTLQREVCGRLLWKTTVKDTHYPRASHIF